MEFLDQYVINEDDRGSFKGIVNKYGWGEINIIRTVSGVTRGNHYHRFTKELFFILEGRIHVVIRNIVTNEEWDFVATSNRAFIVDPYELHRFDTLEDSVWLNMLSHRLDKDQPDFVKVSYEG